MGLFFGAILLVGIMCIIAVFIGWVVLLYWDIQEYRQKAITPLWIRRLKAGGLKIRVWLYNFYYKILQKVIPAKAIIIDTICPLEKCDVGIKSMVLATRKTGYLFEEIIEANFRATLLHLRAQHNVTFFMGLSFNTGSGKFEIFHKGSGYTDNLTEKDLANYLLARGERGLEIIKYIKQFIEEKKK